MPARLLRFPTVLALTFLFATGCGGDDDDGAGFTGDGGAPTTGGASGGSVTSGGSSTGGATTGGRTTGGATTGGSSTGGSSTGGSSTGGSSTGGATTGGSSTGGATTGGATTGGATTGGSSTGGASTGGATTGGATTGGSSTGGVEATGGSSGDGGATATGGTDTDMRDIPSTQIVEEMNLGWNLGNTLDAEPDETGWGNPPTTQAMMDAVKAAGFGVVRIPVTWAHHMGGAPNYSVDEAWMNRVEEVVGYVLSTGMYAILNTHHEEWVSLMPGVDQAGLADRIARLWTQIATRFRDYDDHLIFEDLNEPRTRDATEWTGGTPEARAILNAYHLAAVDAIRATGGNNALRHLMIPTHAANASDTCVADLEIPHDDPRIIVSLHTYYPNDLSFGNTPSWGDGADRAEMEAELDRIHGLLPARGRAVIIGEWGTVNLDNTSVRADHARTYARLVRERGMCPIWWDNGATARGADGFGLLDRDASPPSWAFPDVVTALVAGAREGSGS